MAIPLKFYKQGNTYQLMPETNNTNAGTLVTDPNEIQTATQFYQGVINNAGSRAESEGLAKRLADFQSGQSEFTTNAQGNLATQSELAAQQKQQADLASGNFINQGTAENPLLVPKGSAGAVNLAGGSFADQLKTPTAQLPGVNPVDPASAGNPTFQQTNNPNSPAPGTPSPSPVTTGIPATGVQPPTLPTPSAPGTQDTFYTSLAQQVTNAQANLDKERDRQFNKIQEDKQNAQNELNEIRNNQAEGIAEMGNVALEEKNMKLAQLEKEEKRFDEEYQIQKNLGTQLTNLMTEGNTLIQQMKGVTGLASIRNPRINQTIEGITASVGVIQAALSVSQGLTSQAQSQLTTATNVITSAYTDQLDYYKTLNNFYESQASDSNQKLITLTKDERTFLDAKVTELEGKVASAQANSDYIQKLMTDPDTALAMAQAGVQLTDSPSQINSKMAIQAQQQKIIDTKNEYVKAGYEYVPFPTAGDGTVTIDVGGQKLAFKRPRVEVSGGASLIDPVTGKVISTAPKIESPTSNTPQTIKSGSLIIKESDISQGQQVLNVSRGKDGYVYTPKYLELLNAWKKDQGIEQDFFKYYPPKIYLNPNDASIPQYIRDMLKKPEEDDNIFGN